MELIIPQVLSERIRWGKAREEKILGVVYHAMGEKIVVGKVVYPALEFLQESPDLAGLSYSVHCLARPDGVLVEGVPDERQAWHAGTSQLGALVDLNRTFLSIEFLLPGEWTYKPDFVNAMRRGIPHFTDAQYVSGSWWIATKMRRYNFGKPLVVPHFQVSGDDVRGEGKGKIDPGVGFNHGRLTSLLYAWLEKFDHDAEEAGG